MRRANGTFTDDAAVHAGIGERRCRYTHAAGAARPQAALSLNASPARVMQRIVLPQILPGILSGSLIVFGLSASAFAIPGLLGGRRLKVVATTVYDEFLSSLNWPLGASIAIILLLANLIIMLTYNRILERKYSRTMG